MGKYNPSNIGRFFLREITREKAVTISQVVRRMTRARVCLQASDDNYYEPSMLEMGLLDNFQLWVAGKETDIICPEVVARGKRSPRTFQEYIGRVYDFDDNRWWCSFARIHWCLTPHGKKLRFRDIPLCTFVDL